MNKTRIDQLINILYSLAAIAVLLGALFRLQHYPYGNYLVLGGTISGALIKLGTIIRSD
jgi:hypothetical protein